MSFNFRGEDYRYYDQVDPTAVAQNEKMKIWRGSRERLLDHHSHHMYSNKLHR
jgi:hypothetical protein